MFYSHAKDAQLSLGLTNRDIDNIIGTRYLPESRSNYGRPRLNVLADALKSDRLKTLANSDIFWDEVCSIEYSGEEEVFDLTVDNVHNFIANDIVVHNCIEQDADVVIFPHRPSMNWTKAGQDPPDDLFIVAKQRRGRTGDVVVEYKGSNYMFTQKMYS